MNYDLIVIGSGPGGYVAAIRASQLGLKTAIVEKESLGGVCLNWGCIPTKALLKSAQVFEYVNQAKEYGISVGKPKVDFEDIIKRSRNVAGDMSKGVQFLMKKNKIDVIIGKGELLTSSKVLVQTGKDKKEYSAKNIIVATGARSKALPFLPQDGQHTIGYKEAMSLPKLPKSMVIVGAGAIGMEFAYFYHTLGVEVTVVEYLARILPNEDEDVSKELQRIYKRAGMSILTGTSVEKVEVKRKVCHVSLKDGKGTSSLKADIVLSAVGISPNIENLGLETLGVELENGKIKVDEFYKTSVKGVYAIGDVVHGPALAHVASAEGIICVEKIAGEQPEALDYNNLPGCTYCSPEVASVGYTEKAAKEAGYELKVGKFPFSASGKAKAAGKAKGFIKVVFDAKYGEFLGAHMIGENVTEMIAEVVAARKLETTGHEIIKSVHPHPTMSEALMEAAAAAYGEVIHL